MSNNRWFIVKSTYVGTQRVNARSVGDADDLATRTRSSDISVMEKCNLRCVERTIETEPDDKDVKAVDLLKVFCLGVASASGSVGITYDKNAESVRSRAFDLGRCLGDLILENEEEGDDVAKEKA